MYIKNRVNWVAEIISEVISTVTPTNNDPQRAESEIFKFTYANVK